MTDQQLRAVLEEVIAPLKGEIAALRAQLGSPDRLLPCREVAERYGVSTRTVKRRVEQGEMWAVDRGARGLYFTQEEADRAGLDGILP